MDFHQFHLIDFGVFDSRIKFPNIAVTTARPVECYEIEILIGKHGGCAHIDGTSYPHDRIDFICAKPGQMRHSALPFKCCYLHLLAKNDTAKAMLDSLPDAMQLGDTQEYSGIFHQMMRTDFPNADSKLLFLSAGLNQILALALRDSGTGTFQTGIASNKKALLTAEKYLHRHYHRNIPLQELAGVANISPIYFHKLFSAYFHKTPNQYLLDLRIAQAKLMLLEEEFSLAGIALECGFTSQSYFCSRFKSVTGLTPLQYRKSELSKAEI